MTRNVVYVQCGIRAVKLQQITIGGCLRMDTCVMFKYGLCVSGVLQFHEFCTARL